VEETSRFPRSEPQASGEFPRSEPQASGEVERMKIAILGAGVSGLCMGIQLKKAGIDSFTIFEKSERVGGTWNDNTYPGACCDVPSHFYSFSFEPNPDWSRAFSPQPEIQAYLERCADKYGLRPHLRFGVEIAGACFDERAGLWRIRTTAGEDITANVLVSGLGQLNLPHVPDLPGLADFAGVSFHSARWNHEHDLAGRRVAVIGNGASAIQFIPEIAKTAAKVTIFQRSANWIIPRNDRVFSAALKRRLRNHPALLRALRAFIWFMLETRFFAVIRHGFITRRMTRAATDYLHENVKDPALRAVLTPDYPIGCKRVLISDDYYQAVVRDNVEIVTSPIARVGRDAITTADGAAHPADTIVFATGFETTHFLAPLVVEGLGGTKLEEAWRDGAEAHLGVTVAGFPNLFLLYGPNTNLGHNSIILMIECQVRYAIQCIQELRRRGVSWIDVRHEAMERFNRELQRDLAKTSWVASCDSWYKNEAGKVTNNWSGTTVEYWWRTRHPRWSDFRFVQSA
jgi:cation diffusion facilitator CzcD-associated flavoprotein CzcO